MAQCRGCCFFFFQAEDGIRDLVRSRGLGDVYKRQLLARNATFPEHGRRQRLHVGNEVLHPEDAVVEPPVSYTHLTLPTSDLV